MPTQQILLFCLCQNLPYLHLFLQKRVLKANGIHVLKISQDANLIPGRQHDTFVIELKSATEAYSAALAEVDEVNLEGRLIFTQLNILAHSTVLYIILGSASSLRISKDILCFSCHFWVLEHREGPASDSEPILVLVGCHGDLAIGGGHEFLGEV